MKSYAPVSISVYDRYHHLRACVESLLANPEATNTVLYIFSDAPQPGHEESVGRVRDYIRTISGFAEVRAVLQTTNSYRINMRQAREIPMRDFGRMIRMEDDIVVSPVFLRYMNDALDRFEDDQKIFAITGYTAAFDHPHNDRAFLSYGFSAWGYASWADRNLPDIMMRRDFYSALRYQSKVRRRIQALHPFMVPMLKLIEQGKMNPGDYKASAHQFLTGTFSVRPGISLVQNIGFDGSGMGGDGTKTKIFDTSVSTIQPELPFVAEYDPKLDAEHFHVIFGKNLLANFMTALKLRLSGLLPSRTYLYLKRLRKSFTGRKT